MKRRTEVLDYDSKRRLAADGKSGAGCPVKGPMMEENEKKTGRGGAILSILVLLPVFYVLSVGPAHRWFLTRVDPFKYFRIYEAVYAPVFWLHRNTPLKGPLEAYMGWWMRP